MSINWFDVFLIALLCAALAALAEVPTVSSERQRTRDNVYPIAAPQFSIADMFSALAQR